MQAIETDERRGARINALILFQDELLGLFSAMAEMSNKTGHTGLHKRSTAGTFPL
jgi:hypothetical protein